MTGDAVKEIARLAQEAAAETVLIDGVEYSAVPLHDVRKKKPQPDPLTVHTLAAFAGYLESIDAHNATTIAIHVAGPREVHLVSHLYGDYFRQRDVYAKAVALDEPFPFGRWLSIEEAVIALQSRFTDAGQRADVLRLIGNLKDEHVQTLADDGTTQLATVRAGVASAASVQVPNPVTLAPYRTFREVEQPASPFVLRIRKGHGGPEAALFEADGGAWQLAAIENVRLALVEMTESAIVILA